MTSSWTAHGSIASADGVAIGWSRTYTFFSDGRYHMSGYPSVQLDGRWQISSNEAGQLLLELDGVSRVVVMTDTTMTFDGAVYAASTLG